MDVYPAVDVATEADDGDAASGHGGQHKVEETSHARDSHQGEQGRATDEQQTHPVPHDVVVKDVEDRLVLVETLQADQPVATTVNRFYCVSQN